MIWLRGVRRAGKTALARSVPGCRYFDCGLPSVRRVLEDPEGLVLNQIHSCLPRSEVHYWLEKQKHEIDFVWARSAGADLIAIECNRSAGDFDPAAPPPRERHDPTAGPRGQSWDRSPSHPANWVNLLECRFGAYRPARSPTWRLRGQLPQARGLT